MASRTWCPTCEETFPLHPDGICTTCGEQLTNAPISGSISNQQRQLQTQTHVLPRQQRRDEGQSAVRALSLLAASMENNTVVNASDILPLAAGITDETEGATGSGNGDLANLAGILPPEALNPQAGSTKQRPVSQKVLNDLKSVTLTPYSAELFNARVFISPSRSFTDVSPCLPTTTNPPGGGEGCLSMNAIPGEFVNIESFASEKNSDGKIKDRENSRKSTANRTAALVICTPRTTKGGKLSPKTLSEIALLRKHRIPFVAYVERGDGITFVQKAMVCQRAGLIESKATEKSLCIGVIVGNTTNGAGQREVWPYIMKDSKNEAQSLGMNLPVVMIRKEDGSRLVQWAMKSDGHTVSTDQAEQMSQYTPCQIQIESKESHSHTCPVCTDSYVPGATIVRLPLCGHVFHKSCALAWLTKHNTCPYCRRELPTDDEEYEVERRRREALGSNSDSASMAEFYGHNFYG